MVGPTKEVVADLKAALERADLDRAKATLVYICISWSSNDLAGKDFYSAIGEIVSSGRNFYVHHATHRAREVASKVLVFEKADSEPVGPPFRARLAADWPRNAAAAPLVLAAGGIGGGLAAAAGLASFWVAAPVAALAALVALSLVFTAVPRP